MKKIIFIALFLSLVALTPGQAKALSCIKTEPRVATVESFQILANGDLDLRLKWVYSFEERRLVISPSIDLDEYQKIAKDYLDDELDMLNKLEEENEPWPFTQIVVPKDFVSKLNISVSDIIVTGPPMHQCDYSVVAVFNEGARLKQLVFQGDYMGYTIGNHQVLIEPRKELECLGYSCSVKTSFEIDEKDFQLVPTQEAELQDSVISGIFLLSSSAPQKGEEVEKLFPWGGGRLVKYILNFDPLLVSQLAKEESIENSSTSTEAEISEESKEEDREPSLVIHEKEAEKPKNAIIRFFQWIKSLFSN